MHTHTHTHTHTHIYTHTHTRTHTQSQIKWDKEVLDLINSHFSVSLIIWKRVSLHQLKASIFRDSTSVLFMGWEHAGLEALGQKQMTRWLPQPDRTQSSTLFSFESCTSFTFHSEIASPLMMNFCDFSQILCVTKSKLSNWILTSCWPHIWVAQTMTPKVRTGEWPIRSPNTRQEKANF